MALFKYCFDNNKPGLQKSLVRITQWSSYLVFAYCVVQPVFTWDGALHKSVGGVCLHPFRRVCKLEPVLSEANYSLKVETHLF